MHGVGPFATKQYRMPADPGNKTDENDLYAQHRAAVAGFGLRELELEPPHRDLVFPMLSGTGEAGGPRAQASPKYAL
jgi:hypothetical protein